MTTPPPYDLELGGTLPPQDGGTDGLDEPPEEERQGSNFGTSPPPNAPEDNPDDGIDLPIRPPSSEEQPTYGFEVPLAPLSPGVMAAAFVGDRRRRLAAGRGPGRGWQQNVAAAFPSIHRPDVRDGTRGQHAGRDGGAITLQ